MTSPALAAARVKAAERAVYAASEADYDAALLRLYEAQHALRDTHSRLPCADAEKGTRKDDGR